METRASRPVDARDRRRRAVADHPPPPRAATVDASAAIREATATDHVARRDRRYRRSLMVADLLAACAALLLTANILGDDHLTPAILLGLPLVVLASKLHGLYDRDELLVHKTTAEETPILFQHATVSTLVVWICDEVVMDGPMGSDQALGLWASLFVLSVLFRRSARWLASRTVATERLLLIGDAATYARLSDKLAMDVVDAQLVGRMSLQRVSRFRGKERPTDEATLGEVIGDLDVHRVLIVPNQSNSQLTLDVVRAVKALGIRVSIVPQVFDVVGTSVVFDDISGMTILGVRPFGLSRSSRFVKRSFDLAGAVAGLAILAPVLAVVAVVIRLDSRGPVFFRQERVGRDGRRFRIFKFRTMVVDAEDRKKDLFDLNEAQGLFKMSDDPRVTRAGRFLRRTSLDELPQLINVVRGEMSLVGPRPLIVSEDETIKGYDRRRLHLTPGMTGHWQIMGSSRVPMHEMVKIDYLYVTTWSLFEDLKILARTFPYMLARRGM